MSGRNPPMPPPQPCDACAAWSSRYAQLLDKYEALVGKVLDLKRDGFTTAAAVPDLPPQEPLPEEVERAIQAITEPGTSTDQQLRAFAWGEVTRGAEPAQVATRIMAGEEI